MGLTADVFYSLLNVVAVKKFEDRYSCYCIFPIILLGIENLEMRIRARNQLEESDQPPI